LNVGSCLYEYFFGFADGFVGVSGGFDVMLVPSLAVSVDTSGIANYPSSGGTSVFRRVCEVNVSYLIFI
jgi:hypothetical protein